MLLKYMSIHLKTKLQYRLSFVFITIAQLILILVSLVVMYSLFDRFGGIKGFTLYEALISFSVVNVGYSFAEIFFRGFDSFKNLIRNGTFDLLLVKPRNIYLQIIGSNIGYEKVGRTLGSVSVLLYALSKVALYESNIRVFLLIPMIISSTIIFASIFIIGAAITFYTIEGIEIVNILSDGSKEAGKYPIGIYNKYMVMFFTFIIPLALINHYPVLYLIRRSNNIWYAVAPIFGLFILIPSILFFNYSLKNHQGTGT